MSNGKKLSATGLLERFLFDNRMHYQFVSTLSGGERKRLYLITILMQNPNFLIMDEPTNDLDIFTIQILEDYLLSFGGCLIIVSHDRYFMDKIADHLFVMNGDGTVNDILGNYTKYREFKREKKSLGKKIETQNENPTVKVEKEKVKLTHKERIEFDNLEKDIATLEDRKNKLSEELNKGDLPYSEIEKISNELTETVTAIDTKSERWMELAEFVN
jgi:ATP-binding cassette subfamily F protein uup